MKHMSNNVKQLQSCILGCLSDSLKRLRVVPQKSLIETAYFHLSSMHESSTWLCFAISGQKHKPFYYIS